jgi:hypothetical protein
MDGLIGYIIGHLSTLPLSVLLLLYDRQCFSFSPKAITFSLVLFSPHDGLSQPAQAVLLLCSCAYDKEHCAASLAECSLLQQQHRHVRLYYNGAVGTQWEFLKLPFEFLFKMRRPSLFGA